MTLTLHDIKVWNTGEVIDLVVPSDTDASVDASEMTIAPGFEDPHVHFRDPGQTYKESMISGCAAAASGGYTNVLIMPNTVPAMDGVKVEAGQPGASEVLDAEYDTVIDYLQHYEAAHGVKLPVRYDLCVCASKGRAGHEATEVADWIGYLPEHGDEHKDAYQLAHPVTAISDDGSAVTPSILEQVFENVKESGLYLIEHCEHHDTGAVNDGPVSRKLGVPGIPEDTELKIVERDIDMSRKTGVHVHFQHVSTAISFDAIRKAKAEGLPITCETAPHYIALNDEALLKYGTLAKMNPPLRSEADRQATIAAVADGTVDLLATDHAPHTMEEKELGFLDAPNGIIGWNAHTASATRYLSTADSFPTNVSSNSCPPVRPNSWATTKRTSRRYSTTTPTPCRETTTPSACLIWPRARKRPGGSRGAEHRRGMDRRPGEVSLLGT